MRLEYTLTCPTSITNNQSAAQPIGGQTDSGGGSNCYWTLHSETEYVYDSMRVIQERDINNNPKVSYTRGVDLSGTLEGAGGIGGLLARSQATALFGGTLQISYEKHKECAVHSTAWNRIDCYWLPET